MAIMAIFLLDICQRWDTSPVNDHALEKRGIRRMLEVWHFCLLNYFLCSSAGDFLKSSIANYSIVIW